MCGYVTYSSSKKVVTTVTVPLVGALYRCSSDLFLSSRPRTGLTTTYTILQGACHYLTNRFQMEAPVAPSRSLRGACLREGFAEPPRRLLEPFAEDYEPFAEVAHTEDSTKTPWRVHGASSKGPWMNYMFLHDHDCNRVRSILYSRQ